MNTTRLLAKLKRKIARSNHWFMPAAIITTTLLLTYTLLTLLSVPRAPRLKTGSGDTLYSASNKIFSTGIGKKDGTPEISFTRGNSGLRFVLAGSAQVKPIKTSSTVITFPSVQPGIDLVYTTLAGGLKEELVIDSPSSLASNVFLFDLTLNNTVASTMTTGFLDSTFRNSEGDYLFHFEKPFAIDASGNRTDNVLLQIMEDKQLPGNYSMKLIVDEVWLHDPSRVYPITVDPTIVHDTTAEFAAGTLNRLKDTGSGSSPTLESYYQELVADQYTVGLWHLDEGTDNTCSGGEDVCDADTTPNHGTFANNASFSTTSQIGPYSAYFDGTNDYITFGDLDILDTPSQLTIALWFNRTSDMGVVSSHAIENVLVAQASAADNDNLEIGSNGSTIDLYVDSAGTDSFSVEAGIVNNRWYHLAVVYDSSKGEELSVYLNGEFLRSWNTPSGSLVSSVASPFSLGISRAGSDNNGDYNGYIDDVFVSLKPYSTEEIKSLASRRPSSVYTSEVLDLGGASSWVTAWNSFSWTELGVNTGDGETLYDTTGLVAQWNFNETSGTTATNNAGSCGASCNGTLTGFASIASQDQAAGTGWTANNRRWGAGALMFDGTNDYVQVGDVSSLDMGTSDWTINYWMQANTIPSSNLYLVSKAYAGSGNYRYAVGVGTNGGVRAFMQGDGGADVIFNSQKIVADGKWHHISVVYDRDGQLSIYIDGKFDSSQTISQWSSAVFDSNHPFRIGCYTSADNTSCQGFYNGISDSVSVFSRALSSTEILSNYNAGQIELQTRVGSSTTPDDGSWEAWRPTTGETLIDGFDSPLTKNLVGYWPMDESSGTRFDRWGANNLTANGTGGVGSANGKINGSADFESTESDFLEITDNTSLSTGDIDFTVSAWVNMESKPANQMQILSKQDDGTTGEYLLRWNNTNDRFQLLILNSSGTAVCTVTASTIGAPSTATWYHVVAWHDSIANTCNIKVNNGSTDSAAESGTASDTASNFRIGSRYATETNFFDGLIDEVGFWKRLLSADELTYLYGSGSPKNNLLGTDLTNLSQFGGIRPSPESVIVQENSASTKYSTGRIEPDGATVALWHLDETGGSGAYIKDSTTNANHGTPTGTTLINGVSEKGRSFNGSSDTIAISNESNFDFERTQAFSIQGWVKTSSTATQAIFSKIKETSPFNGFSFFMETTGQLNVRLTNTSNTNTILVYGAGVVNDGKWHHIAMTYTGSSLSSGVAIYVDGVSQSLTTTYNTLSATILNDLTPYIGSRNNINQFFSGSIDEVKVSNVANTAEEIAESYRLGRDHYVNKTISSTDLSGSTSLPFYVAGDRPGNYLQASLGESAYSVGQPDANTVGLWRLEESAGSGAYLKDSSGNNNHGTPTGTTLTEGKVGKARYFNGTSDYINLAGAASAFNISTYTTSAWVFPIINSTFSHILDNRDAAGDGTLMRINTSNQFDCSHSGASATSAFTASTNTWYHIACVSDNSNLTLYVNGLAITSTPIVNPVSITTDPKIGARNFSTVTNYFPGSIDEVRFDNIARTPSDIRSAYEYGLGLRSHPITIDFGARLDAGNLITGSGDHSFTVDATVYGLSAKGSKLFAGDKVIVKENYDGTEYIAQGTVTAVTVSTGAVTIAGWDAGSTFPSGGYTAGASVFKWQREYWNHRGEVLDSHLDAITNLSLRLTSGGEGRTIYLDDLRSSGGYLTNPSGSSITSSVGDRYFQYRAILSSTDEAVSPQLSQVSLDYEINVAPNIPSLDAPLDTATNQNLTPVLQTTATDDDSDYLRYKIELCTNLAMSVGCQTFDQTSSQTSWSGQNAQTSTAYTSGTQATYTVQTPLSTGTTYYWRSSAIDPAGTNTWGSTQVTPYSFTTTTAPSAPTTPWTEGATNPSGIIDLTPEFSAIHNDSDGDPAVYYEIEVNTASDFTGTVMWDTNQTAMASLADGVRSSDVSYAGTALNWGTTYYWRIRFTDDLGAVGAWSATQNFTTNSYATSPSISSPLDGAIKVSLTPTITLVSTDSDSDYLRYRFQICEDLAMTTNCLSFDQTSSQTGWSGQDTETSTAYASGTTASYTLTSNLAPSTPYYLHAGAIDPGGTNTWTSYSTVQSFTTRALNEGFHCLIDETSTDSSLTVTWTDRETNEDNYILERNVDGGGFSLYQTLSANTTSYQDTSISQGNTYQYRIAPYTIAGDATGEWCTTNTLSLQSGLFNFSGLNFSGLNIN